VVVCQCHRVSQQAVSQALDAGASKVGHVVRTTKAGTDCGGCLPQLRELCEAFFHNVDRDASTPGMLTSTG
jgi:NAD(P)H-nitrite reductase large subunit